jgi:uncharacterized protein YecT (DUF1311 family)
MRFLIALALLASVDVASATDWDTPPDALVNALPKGCDASADAGLGHCAGLAFEKADAELNEVWKQVLARFDPKSPSALQGPDGVTPEQAADFMTQWKADLVDAQKAWAEFKDKDCNGARSYEFSGGTGSGIAVTSCLYVYTVTRTEDLKARYLSD